MTTHQHGPSGGRLPILDHEVRDATELAQIVGHEHGTERTRMAGQKHVVRPNRLRIGFEGLQIGTYRLTFSKRGLSTPRASRERTLVSSR